MGIREDQFMGFTDEARAFLEEYEVPQETCEFCLRPFPRKLEEIDHYFGMFDTKYPLFRHVLKDGRTADGFLQAAPWSSGPVLFLGLRVSDGTEFLWTEKEMDELST